MKRILLVASFSLVVLLGAVPAAHAGGRVFVSFGFGYGAGYYGPYAPCCPTYPYAYYPNPYPYPYYGFYGSYGYHSPRVVLPYVPRYYPRVRAYTLYPSQYRAVRPPRRDGGRGRVYGHYVPRTYVRQR